MPHGDRPTHPRPQFRRKDWTVLDGDWQFALDPDARWQHPGQVEWARTIRVPFAPETRASGIGESGFYKACWYRRTVPVSPAPGHRVLLNFGAVDYAAAVWANGELVTQHEGGYTPFSADLTRYVRNGEVEVVVRAEDDPHDLAKPRGKQDWQLKPHSI
jgi:beta-galactosidase/beta-glucuronidase